MIVVLFRPFVAAIVMLVCLLTAWPSAGQVQSCGAPPPAAPQRIKGGESFPPLPLPATPLRRTERKRSPSPPLMIAKLSYGAARQGITPDGRTYEYLDWKSDPADAAQLLQFACPKLGIQYRTDLIGTEDFVADPSVTPVLYITGHQGFTMSDAFTNVVRNYVIAGGTVWGDACCGSQSFVDAFAAFAKTLFPDRRFVPLPSDHPLFRSFFPVTEVTFQKGTEAIKKGPPEIYGVEVGCRAAVLFWRYDMSCGWDAHVHDAGNRIEPSDAMRLGTNLIAYTLSNQELGRFYASQKVYHEEGDATAADAFVFGQVVHEGDWDPDPSAVANLLKAVNANSAIDVKFVRDEIDLSKTDLFDVPFLHMTGHHDFVFSEQEVQNLRTYLVNGGFLLADACCGRAAFDAAFRRELERVLPGRPLEPIAAADPLYSSLYSIDRVAYDLREPDAPRLEGIRVDGFYAVIYSPDDLGNGWEGVAHPLVEGVAAEDSLKLAMNAIMYALTH